MDSVRALVAAAGRGTRAGLDYPKTLYPVHGVPILSRICDLLSPYDPAPTIVASPDGRPLIESTLKAEGRSANIVIQDRPRGMGDAVLRFRDSPAFASARHVILIWGDIPFIQPETVAAMVDAHLAHDNDFTFVTKLAEHPYTLVDRDEAGRVLGVVETRETGAAPPPVGERDIGLFAFRVAPVFEALEAELPGKRGGATGEHGFLYVIRHLAQSLKVEALPIARDIELISLNKIADLGTHA